MQHIDRHAAAAQGCQRRGDGWVAPGPVGAQQRHLAGLEVRQQRGIGQGGLLVVLAGDAPGGGEINKHWFAGRQRGLDRLRRPGLPGVASVGRRADGIDDRQGFYNKRAQNPRQC